MYLCSSFRANDSFDFVVCSVRMANISHSALINYFNDNGNVLRIWFLKQVLDSLLLHLPVNYNAGFCWNMQCTKSVLCCSWNGTFVLLIRVWNHFQLRDNLTCAKTARNTWRNGKLCEQPFMFLWSFLFGWNIINIWFSGDITNIWFTLLTIFLLCGIVSSVDVCSWNSVRAVDCDCLSHSGTMSH